MTISITGVARCSRCNVISAPLNPTRYPTHVVVSLPHDWLAVTIHGDGEDDYTLCPHCRSEALEWLLTSVERKPSNTHSCLRIARTEGDPWGWDFCSKDEGHDGPCGSREPVTR